MTKEFKIIAIIAVVVLVGGTILFATTNKENSGTTPVADAGLLVRSDSQQFGNASAKVTVVEFGDYQCPACAATEPIVQQIKNEYKDRINFVFRHFPLTSIHSNAMISAQAAEAAALQGKFWEMHELLYANQSTWENSRNAESIFMGYAQQLSLDQAKFAADINSDAVKQVVRNGMDDGRALGVSATPTFYINGVANRGGMPYEQFKAKIEAELAK